MGKQVIEVCDRTKKGFMLSTIEYIHTGIFFRNPFQKIEYIAYDEYSGKSAWEFKKSLKNPIIKFYNILIGNKSIVDRIDDWSDDIDWYGFTKNCICSPIYFKRNERRLDVYNVSNKNSVIDEIHSYAYESPYNTCSGCCDVEKTNIILKNGKRKKNKVTGEYRYTYMHIIEEDILNF